MRAKNNVFFIGIALLMVVVLAGCTNSSNPTPDNNGGTIMTDIIAQSGDTVEVDYTGKLETGEVFDTSQGRTPLRFTIDDGQMIAGFNEGVKGMKQGEQKTITLPPAQAYGEVDPTKIVLVDKNQFQGEPQIGMKVQAGDNSGSVLAVGTVVEIRDQQVVVNFNHELAGKTLIFELTLVTLEKK